MPKMILFVKPAGGGGGGGGGGGSFPDLRLHLDAGNGFSSSGASSTWNDLGTAGNNLAGYYATLQSNYINGYPAVYFNGETSYLQAPSTMMNSCNGLSIVAVWKIVRSENKGVFGTSAYSDVEITADPSIRIRNANYNGSLVFQRYATENLWFDNNVWCINSVVAENGDGQLFKNGTEITADVNPSQIQLPTRNGITYRFGQYAWPSYSLFAEMYIAELYIYAKRLTTGERENLEATLNAKYEIY